MEQEKRSGLRRDKIRTLVRGAYDIQKLRIQMGNRIVAQVKAKLGQAPGKPEEEMDEEGKQILAQLRAQYKSITEGCKKFPTQANFVGTEIISDYTELCLVAQYIDLENYEATHFARLEKVLRDYPIYTQFLKGVKGIGPAMAGVIVSEIDIYRSKYASSIWRYAGLDVGPDGRGRSRRKEHLIEVDYVDKDGNPAKRVGITFSPFLKTKLIGVLAGSFLRVGPNKYRDIYDGYKHRLENHPAHMEKTKGHRHAMALRYMVKRFLADLYEKWRELEGLPVYRPYAEDKLGMKPHGPEENAA